MKPLVTILTPTYNRAHTLPRVFDSLQRQTFKDFEWLIVDDGSTDDTDLLVKQFQEKADFRIRYYHQENQHKFITFFRGIELAEGTYFSPLDSDDALLENALEVLVEKWKEIDDKQNIVFVSSLCQDQNGKIVGDKFPKDPLICSIFDMRYKYNVKGDKWGMGKVEIYKKMELDLEKLGGKGFIPEGVFQFQFDTLGLHYCINKISRIYYRDENDEQSLANQFYDKKNAFGLAENYKAFLNIYSSKLWAHPVPIIRNLGGYLKFSATDQRGFRKTISELNSFPVKVLATLLYPVSKFI